MNRASGKFCPSSRVIWSLLVTLFALNASGGDFVLMNRTYTYTYPLPANGGAFNCNVKNFSSLPQNWRSPDDYWNGHFYGYFELIDIPTDNPVGFQLGIYQYYKYNGIDYYETCSYTRAELRGTGDITTVDFGSPSGWWQHPNGGVDFTKVNEFEEAGLAIWSHMPGHVGIICPSASGGDDIANEVRDQYEPCTIRVIIVAVSAGSTFKGWDYYLNGGCTPAKQATPTYGIDYANGTTNKVVPSTDEYSTNSNMSGAQSGNGQKLALTPGTDVYFRTKASGECYLASDIQHLTVPSRPSTPSFSVDYVNERTVQTAGSDIEYAASSSFTSPTTGSGSRITLSPGQDIYLRYKATSGAFASNGYHLVVANRPATPTITLNESSWQTSSIPATMEWSTSASMTSPTNGTNASVTVTPGIDIYIRVKPTASSFASGIQHLVVPESCTPAKQPTPAYGINYFNETTDKEVPSTDEYSVNADMSGAVSGNGQKLNLTPGTDVYFRTKASGDCFLASDIQHLDVPSRPAIPSVEIDYVNEKTLGNIPSTIEYSTSSSFTNPVAGTGTKITIVPGQDLYFWYKATSGSFASNEYHLDVPGRPAIPAITVNFANEVTSSIPASMQYSESSSMTPSTSGNNASVAVTPGKDLYIRTKATNSSFASAIQTLDIPNRPAAPAIQINYATAKTAQNIPSGIEYSANNDMSGSVSGTNVAINVTPGTDLYFRIKATGNSFRSEKQHLVVAARPILEYTGSSTVNQPTIPMKAVLNSGMTGFDLAKLSVTNGQAQNLHDNVYFDVVAESAGDVKVIIPYNAFNGASFASNEIVVHYNQTHTDNPEHGIPEIKVYPIPSSDGMIYIESGLTGKYHLEVITVNGKILQSMMVDSDEIDTIDLHELPKGIYYLKISTEKEQYVQKIILY